MHFSIADLPQQDRYRILVNTVMPRPIAWLATRDAQGRRNLAPFSFFNAVCSNPPTVLFCVTARRGDLGQKDTLKNVLESGEFVVNIVSQELAEQMNLTSAELPPEISEFEFAGLTPAPSLTVNAPRVAESRIHYECELDRTVPVNAEEQGGATVVFGRVRHVHIADELLIGPDKIDPHVLRPVGRMAGASYARIEDIFELQRPVVKKDV